MWISNNFLISGRALCSFPLLSDETLSGLDLHRSCTFFHKLCEFIYAFVLSCLKNVLLWTHLPLLALKIFLLPLLSTLLYLEERCLIETFPLGLSSPKSLTVWPLSSCGSLWWWPSIPVVSTFLMLWPFSAIPHAVMTSNTKLCHCYFITVILLLLWILMQISDMPP